MAFLVFFPHTEERREGAKQQHSVGFTYPNNTPRRMLVLTRVAHFCLSTLKFGKAHAKARHSLKAAVGNLYKIKNFFLNIC